MLRMAEVSSLCSFFFFKQKTAYELRISDWSSDVCSSDLLAQHVALALQGAGVDAGAVDGLRLRGGHVHGELAAERLELRLVALRLEADEDADLAEAGRCLVVDIGADHAVRDGDGGRTAQGHVLADAGDHVGQLVGHRIAGYRKSTCL